MEIQLTKEVQARLDQLSSETGRSTGEFIQDAMAGYLDELPKSAPCSIAATTIS